MKVCLRLRLVNGMIKKIFTIITMRTENGEIK